jgi:hypothetical protein
MQRVAVTARLRPGAAKRAGELLTAGPPFDPGEAGLTQHAVYANEDTVVFVFEGNDVERTLSTLLNEQSRSGAFGAWGALLTEQPRLAHGIYHWSRDER